MTVHDDELGSRERASVGTKQDGAVRAPDARTPLDVALDANNTPETRWLHAEFYQASVSVRRLANFLTRIGRHNASKIVLDHDAAIVDLGARELGETYA